ncbi:hypothetical protein [Saccharopolyspora endophytica]|uniref:Uncharacterized protein n=1 Tax=Saccharopolyspora endophytica TaxID=543886 RepID=A0ABS5DHZ7_9PSEU|nr:hypothetical protein [Saccharopolyspora endophytica]MBQ0925918.1 hypothetical protein [Saccharopolyspora endophytica]
MVHDLGFSEAVGLWWDGQKLEDFTMYGLPMLWWARMGKYLQFVSGAMVVLDLIGPAWFRRAGSRIFDWVLTTHSERFAKIVGRVAAALGFPSLACVLFMMFGPSPRTFDPDTYYLANIGLSVLFTVTLMACLAVFTPYFLWVLSGAISLGRHGHAAKWVSVVLFAAGFHLDLLGS